MVQQISSSLKGRKPMILIEFDQNTFTIRFFIPKSAIIYEKIILTFFHPFDHSALVKFEKNLKCLKCSDMKISLCKSLADNLTFVIFKNLLIQFWNLLNDFHTQWSISPGSKRLRFSFCLVFLIPHMPHTSMAFQIFCNPLLGLKPQL